MSISDKLKNALNKLPPHLGNLHLGTILKNMADSVDASAAAVEGLTTYSETPVRIGTWGDTPVWRKSVIHAITADEATGKEYDAIGDAIKDKENHKCIPLSGCAFAANDDEPAVADILSDDPVAYYGGCFTWDSSISSGNYLLGYIDFATAEENLKTGDDAS